MARVLDFAYVFGVLTGGEISSSNKPVGSGCTGGASQHGIGHDELFLSFHQVAKQAKTPMVRPQTRHRNGQKKVSSIELVGTDGGDEIRMVHF